MTELGMELLSAASAGRPELLRQLLDVGADLDFVHPQFGNSPLYNATYADQVSSVAFLLSRGARPDLVLNLHSPVDGRWQRGVTALMFARSPEATQLLLEAESSVHHTSESGATALLHAVARSQLEIVRLLLQAGADPTTRTLDGRCASDLIDENISFYQSLVKDQPTPPAILEKTARLEAIKQLLIAERP
ncbi:MAG: ankyrin repeat domain-containing protein [Pirellulales bacterium]|nr:ankyrin repeat domain-containing protein [Pirellulales bacterium]